MHSMTDCRYGAPVERGRILSVSADGCTVASLDRANVTSPPLAPPESWEAQAGDAVYFALFDDGDGVIIAKAGF